MEFNLSLVQELHLYRPVALNDVNTYSGELPPSVN